MKRLFFVLLAFALLLPCAAAFAEGGMVPGTYETVCKGFYNDYRVRVTVSEEAITDIEWAGYPDETPELRFMETPELGGRAVGRMAEAMVYENTGMVDAVSGATITSLTFRAAVLDCLEQAGAPVWMMEPPAVGDPISQTVQTDVLVVGSGVAGLSAAISAAEAGARVTLIEKQDLIGGSSVTSAGILYAALDEADVPGMVEYYMERAEGNADEEMLAFHAERSLDTLEFYERLGVRWMMAVPAGTAPEPRARFAMTSEGIGMTGAALVTPMAERAEVLGVTVLTGVTATELITDASGAVKGARAQGRDVDYTFEAGAVVLATGGFDASEEMKERYSPIAVGDFPLSSKGNVGDGIAMGLSVGADTLFKGGVIGFDFVNGSLPNSGLSGVAMYCGSYVLPDGTFVSDVVDYPITYAAIKAAGVDHFFGLYDVGGEESVRQAIDAGFAWKGDTVEELAEATGMDADKLGAAIAQGGNLYSAPYFAVMVKPATIGSMGGLKVNTRSEVLRADGAAIPGLYAAGEVANGAFYHQVYPASGSSLCISTTYGLEAGRNAAAYIAAK